MLQYHILRDGDICGMNSDFDSALDRLRGMIPALDLRNFTSKDIAPLNPNMFWRVPLFSESVRDMEVKLDMNTRQKAVFRCLQAAHARDFLLAIPIDGLG